MMDEREVLNARQVQDIKIPINWEMMKKLYIAPEEIWTLDPWFTRPVL